jgi:D-alanyl-D-alanine carboxypeptidase
VVRRTAWLVCAVALALGAVAPAQASRPASRGATAKAKAAKAPARPTTRVKRTTRRPRPLEGDAAVDAAVEHLMKDARRRGIEVTLSVGSLRGKRRTIAARYAFVPGDPAQNTRLVTAAHALDQLGPGHVFRTPFRTDARGNLYVESGFDPTLDDAALEGAGHAIRQSGVRRLDGDLVVDVDRPDIGPRMRRALQRAGVSWTGEVRRGPAPRDAVVRHIHRSAPLAEVVKTILASRRALDAELLGLAVASSRRKGAPVSAADAASDLGGFLNQRVRLRRFERDHLLASASGRGGVNRMTSDHVLSVLRYAASHERTRPLLDALSADGRLRASHSATGKAQALSGVIEGRGGADGVAFSALATGPSRGDVSDWLGALGTTLARSEPKAPRAQPNDPSSWPKVPDGRLELETTFGRPGEHVVRARLPLGPGGRMATVRLNRKLIPVLEAALADAQQKGLLRHVLRLGGTYKLRAQRRPDGTELTPRTFSTHAYGVSFDINPDARGGDVDPALGEHFQKYGFVWGKFFARNYDPMHFQFVSGF